MQAKDLSREVPRSPFDELEGIPWLPRMIDKARAMVAGTMGDYTPYPCPGDRHFLKFMGLEAAPILELIRKGASDDEVVAHVKRHSRRRPEAIAAFAADYHRPPSNPLMRLALGLFVANSRRRLRRERPGADLRGIDTLPKVLAFDEGHPVPRS